MKRLIHLFMIAFLITGCATRGRKLQAPQSMPEKTKDSIHLELVYVENAAGNLAPADEDDPVRQQMQKRWRKIILRELRKYSAEGKGGVQDSTYTLHATVQHYISAEGFWMTLLTSGTLGLFPSYGTVTFKIEGRVQQRGTRMGEFELEETKTYYVGWLFIPAAFVLDSNSEVTKEIQRDMAKRTVQKTLSLIPEHERSTDSKQITR